MKKLCILFIAIFYNQEVTAWITARVFHINSIEIAFIPETDEEQEVAISQGAIPVSCTTIENAPETAYVFNEAPVQSTLSSGLYRTLIGEQSTNIPILLGSTPELLFNAGVKAPTLCTNFCFHGGCDWSFCPRDHVKKDDFKKKLICTKAINGRCIGTGCNKKHLNKKQKSFYLHLQGFNFGIPNIICSNVHADEKEMINCPYQHILFDSD